MTTGGKEKLGVPVNALLHGFTRIVLPVLEVLHPRHFGKRAFPDFLYYFVVYGEQKASFINFKHITTWCIFMCILLYDYDSFAYDN